MARRKHHSAQTRQVILLLGRQSENWRYGYDISKETGVKSGTLYPMLMRLHDDGLLDAEWRDAEIKGRPPRHVYRLSAKGRIFVASLNEDQSTEQVFSAGASQRA